VCVCLEVSNERSSQFEELEDDYSPLFASLTPLPLVSSSSSLASSSSELLVPSSGATAVD
jgi:hypothetical protein